MTQQLMNDLDHWVGGDVGVSSTGDLGTVNADTRTNQRIVRRLVTPKGSLIFHPTYGAGLPQMIGQTMNVAAITGEIRSQISMEAGVAQTPEPRISVKPIQDGVSVGIVYTSSVTRQPVSLQFNVNE